MKILEVIKRRQKLNYQILQLLSGKNDIGKSTVMEALDVFFHDGKGTIKLDKGDINVENLQNEKCDVIISCVFTDLPEKVVLDGSYETSLDNEYLLNKDNQLEIIKTFKNGLTTSAAIKTEIKALHPSNPNCTNLLQKKNTDLKKIVDELKEKLSIVVD